MGILSDFRKLFFGAKSVGKSALNKTVDFSKEKGEDVLEKTKEVLSDAGETFKEKTSGLREAIAEKSEVIIDKAKDIVEDIKDKFDGDDDTPELEKKETVPESETKESEQEKPEEIPLGSANESLTEKTKEFTEKVGEKVLDAGEATVEKVKEIAKSVGEKVLEVGGETLEKAKDLSEKVGEKVMEAKDVLVEKAKEVAEKLGDKLDETIVKAEAMAEKERNNPKKEFADKPIDLDDSLLDDKDDFFAKADKWADGDHDAFSEGKITINENVEIKKSSAKAAKDSAKAAGFTDLDGDGDEIIDDAILSDDDN